jgi:hypothetical protein
LQRNGSFTIEEIVMPEKRTIERARKDLQRGKSASTAAGEFVRQEMHHIREGKHGAKSAKQAIAIGLSEARRAGVPIPDKSKKRGSSSKPKRASASRRSASTRGTRSSPKRARASLRALKRQPRSAASHRALSRQAHEAARKRPARARSASARKAARTRARAR